MSVTLCENVLLIVLMFPKFGIREKGSMLIYLEGKVIKWIHI